MLGLVLSCIIFWGCCKIGLSPICMMGLLPGNNCGCSGLSSSGGTVDLNAFCFIPAQPWPNLGLTWDIPLASDIIIGFNDFLSSLIFESIPLSMPCTSGKDMPLDLACDFVWTKYFPFSLSLIL